MSKPKGKAPPSPAPDLPAGLSPQPEGYADWLADLKGRIHTAQQRATLVVNRELVGLYWQIGCDILARQHAQGWGAKVIDRLAREKPFISGKAVRRSCASRSITFAPQPWACWRARMSQPICQYSPTSSRLTASVARCWAVWMRPFRSASQSA